MMTLTINSLKHGAQSVYIDDEDYKVVLDKTVYVWGTSRHHTLYAMIQVQNGRSERLHRIIMGAKTNELVDHINGNGLDNRRSNLRITDASGNNQNARKRKNAITSAYKGVHQTKEGKWKAQIQINKKKIAIGTYKSEWDAAEAYNNALDSNKLFGPRNAKNNY